jgi:serine/threonine protein kinase
VKPSTRDFEKIKKIGRGASGVIWLVKDRSNSQYFAMKVVNKLDIIVNEHAESVKTERNALSSIDNPWVVKLFYLFQDPEYLYSRLHQFSLTRKTNPKAHPSQNCFLAIGPVLIIPRLPLIHLRGKMAPQMFSIFLHGIN